MIRRTPTFSAPTLAAVAVLLHLAAGAALAGPAYVCPMDCEHKTYETDGLCPVCGMGLVPEDEADWTNVAILVFDGVEVIDYSGPYEVFGHAGFRVYTVAAGAGPIVTTGGMKVVPAFTLDDAPAADVVVVPGGAIDAPLQDERVRSWIRAQAEGARHVMSVCNGAFILAKTGLLDGLRATTVRGGLEELRQAAPAVTVVGGTRWVDNGKFLTSGGLSTGIDTALHVVAKMLGQDRADRIADHLEFIWQK